MALHPEFRQTSHLDPALLDPEASAANADRLIGRWVNTNVETRGVAEFVIEEAAGRYAVSAVGVGPDGPVAWPRAEARPLANLEEEAGQRTIVLVATFDHGFMRTETQIRVNKGVLVLVFFNTFLDDSGRSDYVTREFYHRPG